MMTIEQQKAYENRISMCSSEGWRDLIEELNEFMSIMNTIDGVLTIEELYLRKGKVELIRWIDSMKDRTRELYDEQIEDKDAI